MYTKEQILDMIDTRDAAVVRGVLAIYKYQTEDEKRDEFTKHNNGVGFNGPDSPFLSSLAQQYQRKGYWSEKQLYCARKRIRKYAGQLVKIANKEL